MYWGPAELAIYSAAACRHASLPFYYPFWRGGTQEFVVGFHATLLLTGLFSTMEEFFCWAMGA
jgi:hypothetical protein